MRRLTQTPVAMSATATSEGRTLVHTRLPNTAPILGRGRESTAPRVTVRVFYDADQGRLEGEAEREGEIVATGTAEPGLFAAQDLADSLAEEAARRQAA